MNEEEFKKQIEDFKKTIEGLEVKIKELNDSNLELQKKNNELYLATKNGKPIDEEDEGDDEFAKKDQELIETFKNDIREVLKA